MFDILHSKICQHLRCLKIAGGIAVCSCTAHIHITHSCEYPHQVEISCLDENDSPPVFKPDISFVLSESFLAGHELATLTAEDPDLDSVLTYSLDLVTQTFFSINSSTGLLTLNQPIDREIYDSYEVVVEVSDDVHTTVWRKTIKVRPY